MKNFSESYTYIFCMLYPWLVLVIFMMLFNFGVIDSTKVKDIVFISIAIVPVVIGFVWFQIKNK